MRVIITGGAGSIGKNLVSFLQKKESDIHILVLDNLTAGVSDFAGLENVDFRCVDVSNREKITPIFSDFKPDYVFHLAAHFANQNSVDFPFSDIETNVVGTLNVLNASQACGTVKKVVYASSSCVYGNASESMHVQDNIFPHETPYAINKYAGEMYMKYFNTFYSLPTVSVRLFNTYGPGEMPGKYRNVIPNFIALALKNEPLKITGDGSEVRDFTFVSDTVSLLYQAADWPSKEYGVFNGGNGKGVSVKELAESIISISGSKSQIVYEARRNWDHVHTRVSDISSSRTELGYNPIVNLKSGLEATINWLRAKMS